MVVHMTNKLKSQNGASLAIALVFLMMCSMAGAVILSAAGAASGRNVGWRKRQQDEYTLSSAGRVLLSEMEKKEYSVITNYSGPATSPHTVEPTGQLSGLLMKAAEEVREASRTPKAEESTLAGAVPGKAPGDMELTVTVPGLSKVKASFSMDDQYNISVILRTDDSNTSYTVSVPASHYAHEDKDLIWENGTKYKREIFKVSWGEGQLKKNR